MRVHPCTCCKATDWKGDRVAAYIHSHGDACKRHDKAPVVPSPPDGENCDGLSVTTEIQLWLRKHGAPCPTCDGTGHGIGGLWCFLCAGTGRRKI